MDGLGWAANVLAAIVRPFWPIQDHSCVTWHPRGARIAGGAKYATFLMFQLRIVRENFTSRDILIIIIFNRIAYLYSIDNTMWLCIVFIESLIYYNLLNFAFYRI